MRYVTAERLFPLFLGQALCCLMTITIFSSCSRARVLFFSDPLFEGSHEVHTKRYLTWRLMLRGLSLDYELAQDEEALETLLDHKRELPGGTKAIIVTPLVAQALRYRKRVEGVPYIFLNGPRDSEREGDLRSEGEEAFHEAGRHAARQVQGPDERVVAFFLTLDQEGDKAKKAFQLGFQERELAGQLEIREVRSTEYDVFRDSLGSMMGDDPPEGVALFVGELTWVGLEALGDEGIWVILEGGQKFLSGNSAPIVGVIEDDIKGLLSQAIHMVSKEGELLRTNETVWVPQRFVPIERKRSEG